MAQKALYCTLVMLFHTQSVHTQNTRTCLQPHAPRIAGAQEAPT